MKVLSLIILVLSLIQCSQTVNYSTFLSMLSTRRNYQQMSLLSELDRLVPVDMKQQYEMEYEIMKAFTKQYFYGSELILSEVHQIFDEFFPRFKSRWIRNMQDTVIRQLGMDTSSEAYLRQLRENPELYSINYQTFKILTYRL